MPEYYEIKLKGHLDQCWSEWFAGLKLIHLERDVTLLSGSPPDQAAIHGLLERIRDLNLTLISVTSGGPSAQNLEKEKEMKTQTNMQKTILVIGGTGMLGRPVSYALKEVGFRVRIMTRDLQKARKVFGDSFEIFAGDPTDPDCVKEVLDNCYGVHISLPTEVEQQTAETVAKVAHKHNVERISYISGATVAEENRWFPMVNRKFLAEKVIRESGVPYTFICPTWIMDILPRFVVQGRASSFGKQPHPYHWVAAEDVARMVATAYGLGEATNQRFIVHGPEAIGMQEALRRYCAAFHPEVKGVSSMPFWLIKLLAVLTHNSGLREAGELMSYFEKVGEGNNLPQVNCILGSPTMTLDMWLQKGKANEK